MIMLIVHSAGLLALQDGISRIALTTAHSTPLRHEDVVVQDSQQSHCSPRAKDPIASSIDRRLCGSHRNCGCFVAGCSQAMPGLPKKNPLARFDLKNFMNKGRHCASTESSLKLPPKTEPTTS